MSIPPGQNDKLSVFLYPDKMVYIEQNTCGKYSERIVGMKITSRERRNQPNW
jgi:hypothetical protein